jgi:DNA-binding GntR family transcriptional regulator
VVGSETIVERSTKTGVHGHAFILPEPITGADRRDREVSGDAFQPFIKRKHPEPRGLLLCTAVDTGLDTDRGIVTSLAATVYGRLKRGLLVGDYPLSVRLAEERLARQAGVSRTPVREALSRLHAEGLVERLPDGGYMPVIPDLHEIIELYEVRSILEAAALARDDHDGDVLAALRSDWQAMADDLLSATPDPEFVLLDEDFHVRLATSAGNRSLAANLVAVNERIRIVRMHDFLTLNRIERTVEQHLAIVDALVGSGSAAAREVLRSHLDESAGVVNERAAAAIGRMLTARRDHR